MSRYPWQAFASHTVRSSSVRNRAHWHDLDAQELAALARAIGKCDCTGCVDAQPLLLGGLFA
jgi:hypothetical protein